MAKVTKLEAIETEIMEPFTDGHYSPATIAAHAYRCEGCGLVWEKRWHAEECEARGHRPTFTQSYQSGAVNEQTGRLLYPPTVYVRRAMRRDNLQEAAK